MSFDSGARLIQILRYIFGWQKHDPDRGRALTRQEIALVLSVQRARQSSAHGLGKRTTAEKLNKKRHLRNLRRRLQKALKITRRDRLKGLPLEIRLGKHATNPLADCLEPNRRTEWIPITRRTRRKVRLDASNLSFIDFPEEAMSLLKQMTRAEMEELKVHVDFLDNRVLDISPYLLIDELWSNTVPVFGGGHITKPVFDVLQAVNLVERLGMTSTTPADPPGSAKRLWAFPVRHHRIKGPAPTGASALRPQEREVVADRFCDWLDDCLGAPDVRLQLKPEGKEKIYQIVQELLCNAERHSASQIGTEGSWKITGYMERLPAANGQPAQHTINMAFLSLGRTISESLDNCAPDIARRIDDYCARHVDGGFSLECLRTVMALQDLVTGDAQGTAEGRGGLGFHNVIGFARVLGATANSLNLPVVTIISGSSCIQVKDPYLLPTVVTAGGVARRQQWFNSSGIPDHPPATSHVYDLNERLPGTLIAVRLTLDAEHLRDQLS